MTERGRCSLIAYDFLDIDVYWNIYFFYISAGYIIEESGRSGIDLFVVLRGDPGANHRHKNFSGTVHIYDYVKEIDIDWRNRFPAAEEIIVISLSPPQTNRGIKFVQGYIPIFPSLWQVMPFRKRPQRPLHISNFKSMPEDSYQRELIDLARFELIQVYGLRWSQVDINTHPLSYWKSNLLLASAFSCYGLMYPYQRGKTLSGRMWQAPLNGCFVISEIGTNPFRCPGVIEVESFNPDSLLKVRSIADCWHLQKAATLYWNEKTMLLMKALGFSGSLELHERHHRQWRQHMLCSHFRLKWRRGRHRLAELMVPLPVRCRLRRAEKLLHVLRKRLGRESSSHPPGR